ncbi:MAG TPA: site-2 protease family protein, partial [Fimbriimonas sp.]|nr:site-2 protease family protein [Fimbriimonas sp.]
DKPLPVLDKDGIPTGKEAISPIIGVEFAPELKRQPFIASVKTAVSLPFIMAQQLAYKITQPKVIVEQSRGVIGMVQETHTILEEQALMVITWCGVISMSLGIMNLLPIGMLDGGQMVIAFAEMLRGGKRLSYNIQMRFLTVGTIIVFAFILFINGRDLVRLVAPAETPAPKIESQP